VVTHFCHLGSEEGRICSKCSVRIYGLGCRDPEQCALYQRARAERAEAVLRDVVVKATAYGMQDGDFIAAYILPTGPIHRAIPLLAERGIHVRPRDEPADAEKESI
jgi:hypothetical protein